MPRNPDSVQVGLRLDVEQLARLDAWAKEHGGIDRTNAIRTAIEMLLASGPGTVTSPSAASGGPLVDQAARDALTKLLARVEALESQLEDIRQQPSPSLTAAADEFLAGF